MNPASEPRDPRTDATPFERRDALVREIRSAVEGAGAPLEVYRVALAGATPLVGATFASVFLRDPDAPHLLRLACAQSWPQSSARFLSDLRIREGRGPTGQAVARGRPVEIEDVFENPELEEWWEPARELGFVAMTAHPLETDGRVTGSVSFYFDARQPLDAGTRSLVAAAAREMAAAAEKVSRSGPWTETGSP